MQESKPQKQLIPLIVNKGIICGKEVPRDSLRVENSTKKNKEKEDDNVRENKVVEDKKRKEKLKKIGEDKEVYKELEVKEDGKYKGRKIRKQ